MESQRNMASVAKSPGAGQTRCGARADHVWLQFRSRFPRSRHGIGTPSPRASPCATSHDPPTSAARPTARQRHHNQRIVTALILAQARSVRADFVLDGTHRQRSGDAIFVLADVLEGETRPATRSLRSERRGPPTAGQDSCRGTPSKGEERGRTRLERVLAPGVRSGPC